MSEAPHDGTLIRLHLRGGGDIIGRYSDKWWGWVALLDPWPLIRGAIRFAGWELISDEELRLVRQQLKLMVPRAAAVAVTATPRPVIVKARKPRPRR